MLKLDLNKMHYMLFVAGTLAGSGIGILATKKHYKKKYEAISDAEISAYKAMADYVKKDTLLVDIITRDPTNQHWIPLTVEEAAAERAAYESTLVEMPYGNPVLPEKPSLKSLVEVAESLATVEEKEEVVEEAPVERIERNIFEEFEAFQKLTPAERDAYMLKMAAEEDDMSQDDIPVEAPDEEDPNYAEGKRQSEEANDWPNQNPYVISYEEFSEEHPEFSKITLTYFDADDVLCDDREEIIPDKEYSIGEDSLEHFGEDSNDKDVVYVRNERLSTDYEVVRSQGSYEAVILGMQEPKPKKRLVKMRAGDDN